MDKAERQKEIIEKLKGQGLRVTKQREGLVRLLWAGADQHLSAEKLFKLARRAGLGLSLATVYNTLNQWADMGLVLRVRPKQGAGAEVYFDTNVSHHHHFFDQDSETLIDIEADSISVKDLPVPPKGKKINGVEVFIRINTDPRI